MNKKPFGGRTSTTKPRIWTTTTTAVLRVPAYLRDRLHRLALHLDGGGEITEQPAPSLFDKVPVTGKVPRGTVTRKSGTKKPAQKRVVTRKRVTNTKKGNNPKEGSTGNAVSEAARPEGIAVQAPAD